ncbi:MAG: ABC transporter ATP-binding protein [Pseudorhodobacter sp.]
MTILTLCSLTKRYGTRTVLDDISLTVAPGERVALLGHNGAGKSTLMKLVLGLIAADGGSVSVAGHVPGSTVARGITAYLPENVAFHPSLTGQEQIRHFLRLRGQPAHQSRELLEQVGLAEAENRRIGTYSKGMRQRVGLAQALIGAPRLMILDEPTSGLDPVSRRDFYALLDELAARGTAILLSSHALSELETRTDRMVILSEGRLVAQGSLGDLRAKAALPLMVTLRARPGWEEALTAAFPEGLRFACPAEDKLALLERIAAMRDMVEDFEILPPTLDDIYARISRRAA